MSRLQGTYPELYSRFQQAPPPARRAATLAACRYAVAQAEFDHAAVAAALTALEQGIPAPPVLKSQLEALAAGFDEEYFELQEAYEEGEASEKEYLRPFNRARALAALRFAVEGSSAAAAEALYEALATTDDPSRLLAVIDAHL